MTTYWKLNKALYGLKEAGHEMLTDIMSEAGFYRCTGDEGVFISKEHRSRTIIGTCVDYLVGITPDEADLDLLKERIENHVELERRWKPSKLLGMECHWSRKSERELRLTQTTLIKNVAATNGATGIKNSLNFECMCYEDNDMVELCNTK